MLTKQYTALVEGHPDAESGTIDYFEQKGSNDLAVAQTVSTHPDRPKKKNRPTVELPLTCDETLVGLLTLLRPKTARELELVIAGVDRDQRRIRSSVARTTSSVSGGTITNNNTILGTVDISGTGIVNNFLTITGPVNNAAQLIASVPGNVLEFGLGLVRDLVKLVLHRNVDRLAERRTRRIDSPKAGVSLADRQVVARFE